MTPRAWAVALALAAGLCGSAAAFTPGPSTPAPSTPMPSPDVLGSIRRNFQEVTGLVDAGKLLQVRREFACPAAVQDALRVVWRDASGQIRKYLVGGQSGGVTVNISQFYGPGGNLSFALIEAQAANGTAQQTRLYYGPAGNVIRQDDRTLHGPGYTFGPLWQRVVQFPEVAFSAPPPCTP